MKPLNFPERKRQRQIRALGFKYPVLDSLPIKEQAEVESLQNSVSQGSQRSRRSKRNRGQQ